MNGWQRKPRGMNMPTINVKVTYNIPKTISPNMLTFLKKLTKMKRKGLLCTGVACAECRPILKHNAGFCRISLEIAKQIATAVLAAQAKKKK